MEVEFTLASRNTPGGSCMSAENVKILAKGTIPAPAVESTMRQGEVARPLRSVNPDQVSTEINVPMGKIFSTSNHVKLLEFSLRN